MNPRNEEKKEAVYKYINDFIKEYGVAPTIREVAEGVRCSLSTAHKYVVRLEEEGLITKYGKTQMTTLENTNSIERIPVIGTVACGKPRLAYEDIEGFIPISRDLFGYGDFFGLIAQGDSMIEANIEDGDIVFVRKQETAEDGDIVVAMVNDDLTGEKNATLKRFYNDRMNKRIILHPENQLMEDFYLEEVEIKGVAVKVLKDLK